MSELDLLEAEDPAESEFMGLDYDEAPPESRPPRNLVAPKIVPDDYAEADEGEEGGGSDTVEGGGEQGQSAASPGVPGYRRPPPSDRDPLQVLRHAAKDTLADIRAQKMRQAALQAAEEEGLHLVLAPGTKSGYKGVHFKPSKSKPYQATACGNRKNQHLGHFVTAEEAALCYARHIGKEACAAQLERQMQGPPVPKNAAAEEALRQATAEGLTLVRQPSTNSGYKGVNYVPRHNKPYQARARCGGGRTEHFGSFNTVEEAALCYARHGRRAAAIAALCETGEGVGGLCSDGRGGSAAPSRGHIHKLAKVSAAPNDRPPREVDRGLRWAAPTMCNNMHDADAAAPQESHRLQELHRQQISATTTRQGTSSTMRSSNWDRVKTTPQFDTQVRKPRIEQPRCDGIPRAGPLDPAIKSSAVQQQQQQRRRRQRQQQQQQHDRGSNTTTARVEQMLANNGVPAAPDYREDSNSDDADDDGSEDESGHESDAAQQQSDAAQHQQLVQQQQQQQQLVQQQQQLVQQQQQQQQQLVLQQQQLVQQQQQLVQIMAPVMGADGVNRWVQITRPYGLPQPGAWHMPPYGVPMQPMPPMGAHGPYMQPPSQFHAPLPEFSAF